MLNHIHEYKIDYVIHCQCPTSDETLNNAYVSRDAEASCHLVGPFILNKHIHPVWKVPCRNFYLK